MKAALSTDEVAGLKLFIGQARCIECHSGPLFTNNDFHNIGVPDPVRGTVDGGRAKGAAQVLPDEFNCLSRYSDGPGAGCQELAFLKTGEHSQTGAFKTPTLRGIVQRAPYMHAGQFASLREVLNHYNQAPRAEHSHSELEPLHLSVEALGQLESFLHALSSR